MDAGRPAVIPAWTPERERKARDLAHQLGSVVFPVHRNAAMTALLGGVGNACSL